MNIIKKIVTNLLSSFLGLSICLSCQAGTVVCAGKIDLVIIHQPGFVGIKLDSMNDYALVCRLDIEYTPAGAATISPSVCKAMYAALLSAKINNLTINSLWFDGDFAPQTCSTWVGFSQVNLRFLPLG